MWKDYELNIKCKKCKTHKKMICVRKISRIGFECVGCHNFYTHPILELIFTAGAAHGRKALQAELRQVLGAAYLHEVLEAKERISRLEHSAEQTGGPIIAR
jgi:hypothetical protein